MEIRAEKQLENLNQFLEEQLWYIKSLLKEKNQKPSQEENLLLRDMCPTTKQSLIQRYWMIQDIKAVMKGEL